MGMLGGQGGGMFGGATPGLLYLQSRRLGVSPLEAMQQIQGMQAEQERMRYYQEARAQEAKAIEAQKAAEQRKVDMAQSQTAAASAVDMMTPEQKAAFNASAAQRAWWSGPDADKGISGGVFSSVSPQTGEYKEYPRQVGAEKFIDRVYSDGRVETRKVGAVDAPQVAAPNRQTVKDQYGIERYVDNGQPVLASEGGPGLPGKESFSREEKLRNEFTAEVKPYVEQTRSAGRLIPILEAGGGGVNDLALITQFMKLLDPGSTVREGEIANVQNAAGVPSQIVTWYNSILSGDSLSPEQRSQVANVIKGTYASATELYKQKAQQYTGLAQRNLVKPENVILGNDLMYTPGDLDAAGAKGREKSGPPIPAPGQVVDGWRFKGGNPGDQNNWERAQ